MGFMDFFKRKSSGDVAKDRLKLLLVSDRAGRTKNRDGICDADKYY